jgi:putative NADPH-quinone reductase
MSRVLSRVLVVYCHPVAGSFVAAVRDRAIAGFEAGGGEVRVTDLYASGFDPAFSAAERRAHRQPGVDPALRSHADDLGWCDTLALVYPTWWSGQPAMLKGWFDRVLVNGVAWELPEGSSVLRPLLGNITSIVTVTTHGSSKLVNAVEGEGGKRTVSRSVRLMCGRRVRTHWIAMYGVDRSTVGQRAAFLDRVERRTTRIARR